MDSTNTTTTPRQIKKPAGPSRRLLQSLSAKSNQSYPSDSHTCEPHSQSTAQTPKTPLEIEKNLNPEEQITLSQTCLCKTHTYTTTTTRSFLTRDSALCLCSGCRHLFGSLYHAASKWPLPLPHHASQNLKRYASPRRPVWVYFCGNCGSQMFLYFHMLKVLVVPIGMITRDTSEFLRFTGYGYLNSTGDGSISEWLIEYQGKKLLRFSKHLLRSETLPMGWTAANSSKKNTKAIESVAKDAATEEDDDVLLAQCQCEGTSFVITRSHSTNIPSQSKTKYKAHLCTCTSCRISGGMDFTSSLILPKTNLLTLLGQQILTSQPGSQPGQTPLKSLLSYQHSQTSTRHLCSNCGALCFWESTQRPETVNVAMGLLYSASGSRAENWVEYTADGIRCRDEAVRPYFIEAVHEGYLNWVKNRTGEV